MIENRNVNIIADADGKKLVLINDIRFKAKVRDDWTSVEEYLKAYIGDFYEIEETSEKIYISADFPDEYASSESRIALKGAVAKAKANAAQAVPELIKIAANPKYETNRKEKHKTDAVYGWYRYNIRFALPVYDDKTGKIARHNIYSASMLVRHANDGRKYLYDILAIKKKRAARLSETLYDKNPFPTDNNMLFFNSCQSLILIFQKFCNLQIQPPFFLLNCLQIQNREGKDNHLFQLSNRRRHLSLHISFPRSCA